MVLFATGKPRPGVIVQADQVQTPLDVLICPFTTTLVDAPLYRLPVTTCDGNGLTSPSQLMVDKVGPVPRDSVGRVIGHLENEDMLRLDVGLVTMLDLGV